MNNIASGISHVQDYDDVPQIEAEWKQHRSEMKTAQRAHNNGHPFKKSQTLLMAMLVLIRSCLKPIMRRSISISWRNDSLACFRASSNGTPARSSATGSGHPGHLYTGMMDSHCDYFEGSINKGDIFAINEQITKIIGAYPEFEQALWKILLFAAPLETDDTGKRMCPWLLKERKDVWKLQGLLTRMTDSKLHKCVSSPAVEKISEVVEKQHVWRRFCKTYGLTRSQHDR